MKFVNFFRSKIYKIANKERNDPIFMRLILIFFYFIRIKNIISFFLSRYFPRTRWQANCVFRSIATRKHNETLRLWPGSNEPARRSGQVCTQVGIFKSCILCRILHSTPYFFYYSIPDCFLSPFKNDRQVFTTVL